VVLLLPLAPVRFCALSQCFMNEAAFLLNPQPKAFFGKYFYKGYLLKSSEKKLKSMTFSREII